VDGNRGVGMKSVNRPMMFLAFVVVAMFIAVGFAIALRNIWLIFVFIVLGFALMAYGISLKKKRK